MSRTAARRGTSQLAKDTFAAIKPYINVTDPGKKLPDGDGSYKPKHTITEEMWGLLHRHRGGDPWVEERFRPDSEYTGRGGL